MELISERHPLLVVVGSGGVGKTTLAAALGVVSARRGHPSLVMTFDPSLRLKDALGVGEEARERPVQVQLPGEDGAPRLAASLLDARQTFDRLVERYGPDDAARRRILGNRFYHHLSGNLAGILEYMAVERLWEVAKEGTYEQVVLDTPPTRQALDFLEAPRRIVDFLESGVLRLALKPWFDAEGHLTGSSRLGFVGRRFEGFLDELVGLELLRDMAEFFQAFEPLFEGFRERAAEVEGLMRSPRTRFVLVAGPGEERVADTLFFARRLQEAGYHLAAVVVNRVHPRLSPEAAGSGTAEADPAADPCRPDGRRLLAWLGERDARGLAELTSLLADRHPLVALPLLSTEPTDLAALEAIGDDLLARLAERPAT
ncbi:MAG TPA: ArsA-related P-loop ATPase [Thermoanaerobaculia bacterium]|nr:ArsA-related P-loop ATPase [Thermoanaerobaculia bacterium]